MEKKEEKCYYLNDINFLCYIDNNAKVGVIPYAYNSTKTAIKNLNNNEVVSLKNTSNLTDKQIADALGINSKLSISKSGRSVASSIIFSHVFVAPELGKCAYTIPDYGTHIDDDKLEHFAKRKLMTKKDLGKYSKKMAKIFEKDNKDIVKYIKTNKVEASKEF